MARDVTQLKYHREILPFVTHEYVEANNSDSVSWDFKLSNRENNPRLRPFICTHMVSILGRDLHPPSKFCGNPCGSFSIILLTNLPTNNPTDR